MSDKRLRKYVLWWKDGITSREIADQLREWDEQQLVKLLRIAVELLYPPKGEGK